jgi:hypothetical protein
MAMPCIALNGATVSELAPHPTGAPALAEPRALLGDKLARHER